MQETKYNQVNENSVAVGEEHMKWNYDFARRERKSTQTWQMVDVLNERVLGLNNLIEQSKKSSEKIFSCSDQSLPRKTQIKTKTKSMIMLTSNNTSNHCMESHVCGDVKLDEDSLNQTCVNHAIEGGSNNNDAIIQTIPNSLAFRDPKLSTTEAGKRMEMIFQQLREKNENGNEYMKERERKGRKKKKKKKCNTSSRLDKEKQERRKNTIRALQLQLEKNSGKYVARAANTLQFKTHHIDQSQVLNCNFYTENDVSMACCKESWPIPLGGFEMNPSLLLQLSVEKAIIPYGSFLMKRLASNSISCNLYVYIFWFVHCRFFQAQSQKEQRYLLSRIAIIFPRLISLMTSLASNPKMNDFLHRCYPFIVSKAIYLGFRYLCPGNHNLFNGAFHRILHLFVFRLLTGVDIGSGTVETLYRQLYPDDDLIGADAFNSSRGKNELNDCASKNKMRLSTIDIGKQECQLKGDKVKKKHQHEWSEDNHPILSRQQQINFDANQINPLLLQSLHDPRSIFQSNVNVLNPSEHKTDIYSSNRNTQTRSDFTNSEKLKFPVGFRKKQLIKHTKPVRWCRTGGVETMPADYDAHFKPSSMNKIMSSSKIEKNINSDDNTCFHRCDEVSDREKIMSEHEAAQRHHLYQRNIGRRDGRRRLNEIEKEYIEVFRGGSKLIAEYSKTIGVKTKT